ncbi:General stress protein 26 [Anaerocolumna jejuensis DSM 15929]|uniref:General stress protein 26 n=1 Tax=Anaerocolumna jejuensis DSM 15929 TaxID=1121322 RepID=A0A1M6TFR9_9FIRM|nr:pyridoxamine 5'-phosphate oxidase family protein [Anaerocolumna jejuensis]SHK55598.1 General stress protein 26 [Anaerocolumna jejuensis DSM 15929]
MEKEVKDCIVKLVEVSRDAVVCSVDEEGYPNAKAMFRIKNEGLTTFWFSTNTSSIRLGQWLRNPKASIYFLDAEGFHGLMLTGEMKVHTDEETKQAFWKQGDEMYYPLGPTDPDYSILEFTAVKGNYYHGLEKHLFLTNEVEG